MDNDIVEVLNTETGARGRISRRWFENEAINNGILVEVDADQKPYVAELYKSHFEPEEADEDFEPDEHGSDKEED